MSLVICNSADRCNDSACPHKYPHTRGTLCDFAICLSGVMVECVPYVEKEKKNNMTETTLGGVSDELP